MGARGEDDDAPDAALQRKRAKLTETLKETSRFRRLLREAATQLRADAAKLAPEADGQRRRLLIESANRMDRYAADMEADDADEDGSRPRKG